MNKPTKQEISDCIAYFKDKGVYAYEHNGGVYVDIEAYDLSTEISNAEIIERAEFYNL